MLKKIKRIVDRNNLSLVWNAYIEKTNFLWLYVLQPNNSICLCMILEMHPVMVCSDLSP